MILFIYVESFIMLVCWFNNVEVFEFFIQYGVDLDMKYVDIGCVNRKLLFIIVFFYSVIEIVKCFFYKYKVLDIEVDDIEFCLEESLLMFLSDLYYLEVEEFVKIVLFYEKFSEKILYDCLLNLIIKNNIYFVFVLL